MKKEIQVIGLIIIFTLFLNSVSSFEPKGFDPYLELNWINPAGPKAYPMEVGGELDVNVNVACKDGACEDVNATLQYCVGDGCSDYADMNVDSGEPDSGKLRIIDSSTPTTQSLGDLASGDDMNVNWRIHWPVYYPYGEKFNLRIIGESTTTDPLTEYLTGRELIKAVLDINSLAGDEETPYFDLINDENTVFVMDILYPGEYNRCRFNLDGEFSCASRFCYITDDTNSTATCELMPMWSLEPLEEGSYTYYYICHEWNTWWPSPIYRIDFVIDFTSTLSAAIISPNEGNEVFIGDSIDFKSNIYSNFFDYTVEWDSNKDVDWRPTDENFSSSQLSTGDHNITLKVVFDVEGGGTVTKIDSVNIRVNPIPMDVLAITSFEVNPEKGLTTEDSIQITATVFNYSSQIKETGSLLEIINAETGKTVLNIPSEATKIVPPNDSIQLIYNIDFPTESITKGNYKIKLDIKEYDNEQNKENNHATKIITVLEPKKEVQASELSIYIIPLLLITVLIILNREKIRSTLKKTKKN